MSGVALVCALFVAGNALAQRVLVVRPASSDALLSEAFNRLRAELALQDFEVIVLAAPDAGLSADALEAEAQANAAFAGISLTRGANGASAEVLIADRVTGKISERRVAIGDDRQAPSVLAVRAADLLRSSLRELPPGELPPPDVVGVDRAAASPAVRAWSAPRPRWQLRAAGSALGGAAGVGVAVGGSIAIAFRPTERLALGLSVHGPLIGARYAAANGAASLRQEAALARASWQLWQSGSFSLAATLGAGGYHLLAQGEVRAPLRGRSANVYSFAASGGLDAELGLTPVVSLGASLSALVLAPRPVVAIDTSERELSAPLLLASLGLGVAF